MIHRILPPRHEISQAQKASGRLVLPGTFLCNFLAYVPYSTLWSPQGSSVALQDHEDET